MSESETTLTETERLTVLLSRADRPRCEYGHDGICLNVNEGRPYCPVPEHTPKRIVDLEDASVVWEADENQGSPDMAPPAPEQVVDR